MSYYSKFFVPKPRFTQWMKQNCAGKHIYDVGAGVGQVSALLSKKGFNVTALDQYPRPKEISEFDVQAADATTYQYEPGSVVMFCRPCHSGFVLNTIKQAIACGVAAIVYVGLTKNVVMDLDAYKRSFVKKQLKDEIGHANEHIWYWLPKVSGRNQQTKAEKVVV